MAAVGLTRQPVRCNATELMLHSGRNPGPAPPRDAEFARVSEVDQGLRMVGRGINVAMRRLEQHRTGPDADLRAAYRALHDAITDLAAVYNWITLATRPAPPARPARHQRPWGG
jgi:hypothetical protein